jgi:hypothetical protein
LIRYPIKSFNIKLIDPILNHYKARGNRLDRLRTAGIGAAPGISGDSELPCLFLQAMLLESRNLSRKEDHAMQYYFRFNRQRGPVNALQMRLQG